MGRFTDKVVIVTGSSAGIGKAVILGFAKEGASVVLHGTNTERLADTEADLRKAGIPDNRILKIQGYLNEDAAIEKVINETVARFGKIDVLINNAGVFKKPGGYVTETENYDYVLAVNVRAVFRLVELATPYLEKTKGNIINVSSALSFSKPFERGYPGIVYGMSKAAVDRFTQNINQSLMKKGIRINNINPGPFESLVHKRHFEPAVVEEAFSSFKKVVEKLTTAGRLGQPEELVPAFLLLADEKFSFITGSIWVIDGGTASRCAGNSESMGRFTDKVVIVTGSSAGIGKAIILGFAKEGANVVLHGTNTERLADTEADLRKAGIPDNRILKIQGYLNEDAAIEKVINETVARFGKIDVLVNNAGVYKKPGGYKTETENYDYVFAVNVRAVFRLVELATPHLEKTKGNIINVSSALSISKPIERGYQGTVYGMSKSTLDRFTKNINQSLMKKGIRINNINPGPFESLFHKRHLEPAAVEEAFGGFQKLVQKINPAGRFGQPEELIPAILLLADEKSSFITGSIWVIDGGTSTSAPEAGDLKL
uniref:Short-chain dehydrogenase n=1 Tax=Panagrellus redivivus TaxID=6233 RepID=A0A7E4VFU3_PANRE